jgi:hypothetical protein
MRINIAGNVGIGTTIPEAKLHVSEAVVAADVSRKDVFRGTRQGTAAVQNSVSTAFSLGASTIAINPYGVLDIKANGLPGPTNNYGLTPDVTVMSIIGNGTVGIGYTNPPEQATLTIRRNFYLDPTTFKVGGNSNTFYKVRITSINGYAPSNFTLTRMVHDDGSWTGSMHLQVEFRGNQCGNGSSFWSYRYTSYYNTFVARIVSDDGVEGGCASSSIWVWLRGDRTYYFTGQGCFVEYFSANGTSPGTVNTLTTQDEHFASAGTNANISYDTRSLRLGGELQASGPIYSWRGGKGYHAGDTTWDAGNPWYWPWSGKVFYITFKGDVTHGANCIFGHFLVLHPRWTAGNNSSHAINVLAGRYVYNSLMTDSQMIFTFSSPNAQYVDITVSVVAP